MKQVYRFGNQFWIEGDWTAVCTVDATRNWARKEGEKETISFKVSYGSRSLQEPEDAQAFANAVQWASTYAGCCPDIFKDKTREQIRDFWDESIRELYKAGGLYDQWNPRKT